MFKNEKFIAGFDGQKFIVTGVKPKKLYDAEGKPTSANEAVRVTAVSRESGEIQIDLVPYADDKLERMTALFGVPFTVNDLTGVTDCKIYVFNGSLRVTITAVDLEPSIDV